MLPCPIGKEVILSGVQICPLRGVEGRTTLSSAMNFKGEPPQAWILGDNSRMDIGNVHQRVKHPDT